MKSKDKEAPARREFLKLAGLGTGAAVAAGLSSGVARAAAPEVEKTEAGYRETDHVRRYYELAKV